MTETINLGQLNITQGFSIIGDSDSSGSGRSVSGAGDVNGDGYVDIIIGAPYANSYAGKSYIVYGGDSQVNLNLDNFNISQGIIIYGDSSYDYSGRSVSGAGDVNGDGYADFIIGAPYANSYAGKSYLIYGGPSLVDISLSSLNSTQGVIITGINSYDNSGYSVSGAGDVNGDGYDDVIVGAPDFPSVFSGFYAGESYIIYGSPFQENINLVNLTITEGITITGDFGNSGTSVSGAGDVNGDGYADVIIGAPFKDDYGYSYVIYGNASLSNIMLSSLNINQGFYVSASYGSQNGNSVSGAGDVNGDGYDDIIMGAPNAGAGASTGESYVIYGNSSQGNINLADLTLGQGFSIAGVYGSYSGFSVSGAGDVNGDGYADVIVGAYGLNSNAGESYVLYGGPSNVNIDLSSFEVTQGFSIAGVKDSASGYSVSGIKDINKDGYADIIIGAPGNEVSYVLYGGPSPTVAPTDIPTESPIIAPTVAPTVAPTAAPTVVPTAVPTMMPVLSSSPTNAPTKSPTAEPTFMPTQAVYITDGGSYNGTGSNQNFIIDASSDLTIYGSENDGNNMYTLDQNSNVLITVTNFNNISDVINLKSFDVYSYGDLTITAGSIVISLEDNQTMKLLALSPGDINATNFVFADPPATSGDSDSSEMDAGELAGIVTGAGVFLVAAAYGVYAYTYGTCPFAGASSLASMVDKSGTEMTGV